MQEQITQEKDLSTLKTFKRLWPTISPFKAGLITGAVALVLNALVDSSLIYLLKPLLDEGFGQANNDFLKLMAVLVVVFILVRGINQLYCQLLFSLGVRQGSNDITPPYFSTFNVYAGKLF